ncbi:hypothetical protein KAT51_02390 [bacterium]|nr:hypothetical protein [bacterium]
MNTKNFFIVCLYIMILCCLPSAVHSYTASRSIPIKLALKVCPIALKKYSDTSKQVNFIRGYRDGYKFALIMLNPPKYYSSSLDKEKTPYATGYRLGKKQGFEDIKKNIRSCTFVDFGYKPVELKGKFIFKFERPEFITSDGETYVVRLDESTGKNVVQKIEVIASGYLSPEGRYGHMNRYTKEFIVRSINKNK